MPLPRQVVKRDEAVMEHVVKRGEGEVLLARPLHGKFVVPVRKDSGGADQSHEGDFHVCRTAVRTLAQT